MRKYCAEIENDEKIAQKYHKNIKKIEEWYLKMYERYKQILKTEVVYNLFNKEKITGENDDIVFDILNNYEDGFDTKVSVFAMTDILCKHLLSLFCFGPENDGVLNFLQQEVATQNGRHISWFDYKGGAINLIELVQYYFEKENIEIAGVDLSNLLADRAVRNSFVHNGEFEICLSGIRRFNILRSIIVYFDENAYSILPEFTYPCNCSCDMQAFFALTDNMDFREKTTILVTDSMLDLNQSMVSDFLSLPWNLVLDFSGGIQNQGMRKINNSEKVHQQTISMGTCQNILKNLSLSANYTEWLICGEYLTPCLGNTNQLQNMITNKDPFFVGDRRAYTNYIDGIMKELCNIVKNYLKPVTIVFMYIDDTVASKMLKYCEEVLYTSVNYSFAGVYYWDIERQNALFTKVFGDYADDLVDVEDRFQIYPCNIISFIKGLRDYGIFQQIKDMNGDSHTKKLPFNTGFEEISNNLSYDLEKYFDVLYENTGENVKDKEELLRHFYRGGNAPWSAFYDGSIVDLIPDQDKKSYINKIKSVLGRLPERKTDKIIYIEHAPGIGGSTLLRSIGWELSKEYPVMLVHAYDKIHTKRILEQLYDTSKKAFVVLVDEDFSELEDLEGDIKNIQRPCVLIVSIRYENITSTAHVRLQLKRISASAERQLRTIFKINSPLTKEEKALKDARYDEFIRQDGNMKSPFMIGLYYMDREFYGVNSYVSRVIDSVESKEELWALGFIALADIYGQIVIPKMLFNKYLGLSVSVNYVSSHSYIQSILLYDTKTASYKSKHPLISRKLLDLCSMQLYQSDFLQKMKDWALKYIDFVIDEWTNGFQDIYQTLLEKVFIRNRVTAIDDTSQSDFSQYIEKVQLPEHKIDILEYLAEKCRKYTEQISPEEYSQIYLMTSHFYGHLARLYGKKDIGIRNYEKALISSKKSMEYMEKGGDRDSRIYHMHAKTRSDKLILEWESRTSEEYSITKEMYENYEDEIREICRIYEQSAEYGGGDYAYPSEMDLLIKYIKFVYCKKNISSKDDLEKLTEVQQEFRTNIGVINDQLETYDFDENMVSSIDRLIRIYRTEIMLGDYGKTIQYYENKLKNALTSNDLPSVVERYRAGLINAKIGKYKILEGKKWIFNPETPQKDIDDILDNLELALAQGYDIQSFSARQRRIALYNNWMTIAKYSSRSISSGITYAYEWKLLEEKDKQIDPRPYYYLYVLYYLSVLEGNIDNKKYVAEYQELSLKKATQVGKSLNYIRDLLTEGKGMGQLLEIHCMSSEITSKAGRFSKIKRMEGKFIDIVPGKGIIELRQPPVWLRYKAKFDLLKQNSVGESQLTHELSFYGGFSYEQITAINASVKDLTTGEQNISEEKKEKNFEGTNILANEIVDEVNLNLKNNPCITELEKVFPKNSSCMQAKNIVSFNPDDGELRTDGTNYYLNGFLPNDRRGGLCSTDIIRFGDVIDSYGGAENILMKLRNLKLFDVIIKSDKNPNKCSVSLYDTGISLNQLFEKKVFLPITEMKTDKVVENKHEQPYLPDIKGSVTLYNCDYSKSNYISGEFVYNEVIYKGIIPYVSSKILKKIKNQQRIQVRIVGKNELQYILKL